MYVNIPIRLQYVYILYFLIISNGDTLPAWNIYIIIHDLVFKYIMYENFFMIVLPIIFEATCMYV